MAKKMKQQPENLLDTLGDFTNKSNWDDFFRIRGDVPFDWYAEWPELEAPLLANLSSYSTDSDANLQILVPGCGNSLLSEHLYDAGFHFITNIDFSKVAISNMLRRNVRSRPDMLWRVMDMTSMKFMDATFDIVVDKGGLDALMEPEYGTKLGSQYLSEVKRVLKSGGRFICLTLAESHVLGSLFPKFRFGWKTSLYAIPLKTHDKANLQTFMVIIEKETTASLHQIASSFNQSSLHCSESQARGLYEALDNENRFRSEYFNGSDIMHSLEDLQLGVKGDLLKLNGGRRVQVKLGGEEGGSSFSYKAVVLDSPQHDGQFIYYCGVFLVPETRAGEWLFSSEEGQWLIVENSKAARLIMVLLDSSHANVSMEDIQKDLSPLMKQLAPENHDDGAQIPFMIAGDGIKHRKVLHQVTSALTGPIIVEDVVYDKDDCEVTGLLESQILTFRRLTFNRAEGLVQSEALLTREKSLPKAVSQTGKKKSGSSKSKIKEIQRQNDETSDQFRVYHNYLASSYHIGIISGFVLLLARLEHALTTGIRIKTVIVGLGAGLLPMFLHECMDFLRIEVVELDPLVFNLATSYFGFREDSRMKVHVADGIQFVGQVAKSEPGDEASLIHEDNKRGKIEILIIDVDSSDSSSGLRCPAADFVEPYFLLTVKDSLAEQGLFVVNLVSRSPSIKDMIIARMKDVFSHLYSLQLESDVNEVLFALQSEECIKEDHLPEAAVKLEKLMKLKQPEMRESIIMSAHKLKRLK